MSEKREERETAALDPRTITGPGWPVALATLEQIKTWAPEAQKLGILALLLRCTREMAQPGAPAGLVTEAQEYLDALRHMPWG